MTTIKLPKFVTLENTANSRYLSVSTSARGDLVFDATDPTDPGCIFETVENEALYQGYFFKSTSNGKLWRRSLTENPKWVYADAAEVADADSFQLHTQDATNTLLSLWSPPDAMFLRSYTTTARTHALAVLSRDVEQGGADVHTRFRIIEAAAV